MIKVADFLDDFYKVYEKAPRKIVVYGAGSGLRNHYRKIPVIDYICDKNAEKIKKFQEKTVFLPDILKSISEPVYIIITIVDARKWSEVLETIKLYHSDALVFYLYNNIGFGYSFWNTTRSYVPINCDDEIRVNIICEEETWIFKKFADRLKEHLRPYCISANVSSSVDKTADINHHIPYANYEPCQNDTLMITHIDNYKRLGILKKQLRVAGMGICMSKQTMNRLISFGLPARKLCYINPAQDNIVKPQKYVLGITNRCYDHYDARKRSNALLDILEGINPDFFQIIIMGSGWEKIVQIIREKGFEVLYYPEFVREEYYQILQQIDYYIYMGFDEGAMGYLDALRAGVGTIVTPQGYHLDVDCKIDYPCSTVGQFRNALLDLQGKRQEKIEAVEEWSWENYAMKHAEIWNYLLKRKPLSELYKNQLLYEDGIFSTLIEDNRFI